MLLLLVQVSLLILLHNWYQLLKKSNLFYTRTDPRSGHTIVNQWIFFKFCLGRWVHICFPNLLLRINFFFLSFILPTHCAMTSLMTHLDFLMGQQILWWTLKKFVTIYKISIARKNKFPKFTVKSECVVGFKGSFPKLPPFLSEKQLKHLSRPWNLLALAFALQFSLSLHSSFEHFALSLSLARSSFLRPFTTLTAAATLAPETTQQQLTSTQCVCSSVTKRMTTCSLSVRF